MNEIRIKKTLLRDPVSGLSHLFSACAALIGMVVLLVLGWGEPGKAVSLGVYGLSLILMFSASAAYHLVNSKPEVTLWLRKLDHSAIYILIAGTYTPICLEFFTGFWEWGILLVIWSLAVSGVAVKLFVIKAPRGLTAGVYLVMGWLSVAAIREIIQTMPAGAIFWLVSGGLLFTMGAVVYITKKPDPMPNVFGFHEIWHIFVILGCLAHFILIAAFIAPA